MDSICWLSLVVSLISPNSFNAQQQASSSRNEVDPSLDTPYTGKGVKVGIIDEPLVVNETFWDGMPR